MRVVVCVCVFRPVRCPVLLVVTHLDTVNAEFAVDSSSAACAAEMQRIRELAHQLLGIDVCKVHFLMNATGCEESALDANHAKFVHRLVNATVSVVEVCEARGRRGGELGTGEVGAEWCGGVREYSHHALLRIPPYDVCGAQNERARAAMGAQAVSCAEEQGTDCKGGSADAAAAGTRLFSVVLVLIFVAGALCAHWARW